jgi:acetyl esterase/lipase
MRRLSVVLVVAAMAAMVLPSARGAEPVRYRDEVFSSIKTTKDLQYGEAVNYKGEMQDLLLDVHEPAGDTAKLRAAVVWVHGGYFIRGSKESESYVAAWTQFVKAGYVTVAINYRLQDPETFPEGAGPAVTGLQIQRYIDAVMDAQHDAQAAIRWVRKNAKKYRVNPEQVAIAGHSAGGITAQQVNYNDHDPGNSGNPGYSSRPNATVSSAGTGLPVLMTRVDPLEPPMLMSHGLSDNVVPFMPFNCVAAIALGNTCELVLDPDQGHGQFGFEYWRDFLYRQMIAKPEGLRPPTNVTVTGFPS